MARSRPEPLRVVQQRQEVLSDSPELHLPRGPGSLFGYPQPRHEAAERRSREDHQNLGALQVDAPRRSLQPDEYARVRGPGHTGRQRPFRHAAQQPTELAETRSVIRQVLLLAISSLEAPPP